MIFFLLEEQGAIQCSARSRTLIHALLFISSENEDADDPDLFQGDMILSPEERMSAELGLDASFSLSRGSINKRLWPNAIVHYEINKTLGK